MKNFYSWLIANERECLSEYVDEFRKQRDLCSRTDKDPFSAFVELKILSSFVNWITKSTKMSFSWTVLESFIHSRHGSACYYIAARRIYRKYQTVMLQKAIDANEKISKVDPSYKAVKRMDIIDEFLNSSKEEE